MYSLPCSWGPCSCNSDPAEYGGGMVVIRPEHILAVSLTLFQPRGGQIIPNIYMSQITFLPSAGPVYEKANDSPLFRQRHDLAFQATDDNLCHIYVRRTQS